MKAEQSITLTVTEINKYILDPIMDIPHRHQYIIYRVQEFLQRKINEAHPVERELENAVHGAESKPISE